MSIQNTESTIQNIHQSISALQSQVTQANDRGESELASEYQQQINMKNSELLQYQTQLQKEQDAARADTQKALEKEKEDNNEGVMGKLFG
jgi:hypothetical protein